MRLKCFLGFHDYGEVKDHSLLEAPFHIITAKYRQCKKCLKYSVIERQDLFYKRS